MERDFSNFVDKADDKYQLAASHDDKETFIKSKLQDVQHEVEELRTRVRDLERQK